MADAKTLKSRLASGEFDARLKEVYLSDKAVEDQKKRDAVIIIACHDKEELDQLSDEIIEISDGRIINKTC